MNVTMPQYNMNVTAMEHVINELKEQLALRQKVQAWLAALEEPYDFPHLHHLTSRPNTVNLKYAVLYQEEQKPITKKVNENKKLIENPEPTACVAHLQPHRRPRRPIPMYQNETLVYRSPWMDKTEEKKKGMKKVRENLKKGIKSFKTAVKEVFCSCYGY